MKVFDIEDNNVIINTIVCESFELAKELTNSNLIEVIDFKPSIGWIKYNEEWRPPKPFDSWIWNGNEWLAPVEVIEEMIGFNVVWNEDSLSWIYIPIESGNEE